MRRWFKPPREILQFSIPTIDLRKPTLLLHMEYSGHPLTRHLSGHQTIYRVSFVVAPRTTAHEDVKYVVMQMYRCWPFWLAYTRLCASSYRTLIDGIGEILSSRCPPDRLTHVVNTALMLRRDTTGASRYSSPTMPPKMAVVANTTGASACGLPSSIVGNELIRATPVFPIATLRNPVEHQTSAKRPKTRRRQG